MYNNSIENILKSKKHLAEITGYQDKLVITEAEGGCGVIGFCCTEPVPGKHIPLPML